MFDFDSGLISWIIICLASHIQSWYQQESFSHTGWRKGNESKVNFPWKEVKWCISSVAKKTDPCVILDKLIFLSSSRPSPSLSHIKTMGCLHRDHTEHEYKYIWWICILDQSGFSDLEENQTKANYGGFLLFFFPKWERLCMTLMWFN